MGKIKFKKWSEAETARIIKEINLCKNKEDIKWTYNILAEEFGITPNAVYNKYHTSTKNIIPDVTHELVVTTKKTSRFWSRSELKKLVDLIELQPNTKKGHTKGFKEAAKYFGVTKKAIYARYTHYKNNTANSRLDRNTTKVPVANKRRGKYKPRNITKVVSRGPGKIIPLSVIVKTPELRSLTFDIQDVKVDVVNKKLTILF